MLYDEDGPWENFSQEGVLERRIEKGEFKVGTPVWGDVEVGGTRVLLGLFRSPWVTTGASFPDLGGGTGLSSPLQRRQTAARPGEGAVVPYPMLGKCNPRPGLGRLGNGLPGEPGTQGRPLTWSPRETLGPAGSQPGPGKGARNFYCLGGLRGLRHRGQSCFVPTSAAGSGERSPPTEYRDRRNITLRRSVCWRGCSINQKGTLV